MNIPEIAPTSADKPEISISLGEAEPAGSVLNDRPGGKPLTVKPGSAPRPVWTVRTVLLVGMFFIFLATACAWVRDELYIRKLESRQEAATKKMQNTFPHFR